MNLMPHGLIKVPYATILVKIEVTFWTLESQKDRDWFGNQDL